jgi:hypothetical protein
MVGAMSHNSTLVIIIFSCGSAHAKAGGERYHDQTGGEGEWGLAERHGLFPSRRRPYANIAKIALVPRAIG